MCRLKLIYEECISAFGADYIQLPDRNKSTVINIMNILRYYCHSKGENKVSCPIILKLMKFHILSRR